MKKKWDLEELIKYFTIMPNKMYLVGNKTSETRLDFIVLLEYFQIKAKSPNSKHEIKTSFGIHS